MFLLRQIAATLCEGEVDSIADGPRQPYKYVDSLPKYVMQIGDGKVGSDYIRLDATDSYVIPLPENYDTTQKLSVIVRSNAICKLVIVDPDLGTSTLLLKGCNGETDGDHFGMIMWQGRVSSITVSVPTAFDPALIEYFIYEVPDLNVAASYRIGERAIGYVED